MRIVLDTSVLVSALITRDSPPDRLYQAWRREQFDLITSAAQITELTRVIGYERLQKYIRSQTEA